MYDSLSRQGFSSDTDGYTGSKSRRARAEARDLEDDCGSDRLRADHGVTSAEERSRHRRRNSGQGAGGWAELATARTGRRRGCEPVHARRRPYPRRTLSVAEFEQRIIAGASKVIYDETAYNLVVLPHTDAADPVASVRHFVESAQVDGLIFAHTTPQDERAALSDRSAGAVRHPRPHRAESPARLFRLRQLRDDEAGGRAAGAERPPTRSR